MDIATVAERDSARVGADTIDGFCQRHKISRGFAYLEIKRGRLKVSKYGRATRVTSNQERDYVALVEREAEARAASLTPAPEAA
jgi:hypothetical protein